MSEFLYFTYGSNMCTGRLKDKGRCPSCKPICVAKLIEHELRFHKLSKKDRSGKADAYKTENDAGVVWGVVFSIDEREEKKLDNAEGLGHGYNKSIVEVVDREDNVHQAKIYKADEDAINPKLRPYTWYKRFVIVGARQHHLPEDYINTIDQLEAIDDDDENRDAENRAIQC